MSRTDVVRIDTPHFTIEGSSRAGIESWFKVRELGIALDIGRCPDALIGVQHVLITHAHLDHAAGIPFYAAQRKLQNLPPGTIYIPHENLEDYEKLMQLHEKLENTRYPLVLAGLSEGDMRQLRRNLWVRTHRATHRVVTNAYEIIERRRKLKSALSGLDGAELEARRRGGEAITDEEEHSLLFYTGDTDRRIFDRVPALFAAEVLMIECSFTDPEDRGRAERYAHIHLEDLWEESERFQNEIILLTHFSMRDNAAEIRRQVLARCPERLRQRLRLMLPE